MEGQYKVNTRSIQGQKQTNKQQQQQQKNKQTKTKDRNVFVRRMQSTNNQ
jgi:hypothetical protein